MVFGNLPPEYNKVWSYVNTVLLSILSLDLMIWEYDDIIQDDGADHVARLSLDLMIQEDDDDIIWDDGADHVA